MVRNIKRKFTAGLVSVLAACSLAACAPKETAVADIPEVTGEFKTEVLSTGKSDAIILTSENYTIIIDCGEKNDGDEVVEYLEANGITTVDYLFITHFDKDHVGGAAEVIENVEVKQVITPDYEGTNDEYADFISAAQAKNVSVTRLTENMTFVLDDVLYEVYPPLKSVYAEEDNDYSIVIKATHGEDVFLFTGDAETERLKELYDQLGNLSAAFLKVPHHGRIDSESESFIEAVNPAYAVITCSKKEGAEEELLAILDNIDAKTYLTTGGNVTAVSSGNGITVTQTDE